MPVDVMLAAIQGAEAGEKQGFDIPAPSVGMRIRLAMVMHPDKSICSAMRWYYQFGRRVWLYEIWNFIFRDMMKKDGPTLKEFWGQVQGKRIIMANDTFDMFKASIDERMDGHPR